MLYSLFNGALPKAIFFDLDGTLIDSLPDLSAAVDAMLIDLSFKPAGIDKARLWVGNGSEKLVQRALADVKRCSEEHVKGSELEVGHEIFLKRYARCSGFASTLYSGVVETLKALQKKNIQLCIITNKPKQFTPSVLKKLGINDFFELVLSGDSLNEKKPSPMPILHAVEYFKLNLDQVLMVGDSKSDILSANTAGIKSVCVTYGYNHGDDPLNLPADRHIDKFSDLIN